MDTPKIILSIFLVILVMMTMRVIFDYLKKDTVKFDKEEAQKKILYSSEPREGLKVDVLKQGKGKAAERGRTVRVHYTAWLESGLKVDSSYDKGEVFTFQLGNREVISGWEDGMLGMLEGEQRKFTIAPEHAYGEKGKANVPGNAIIIFEVELLQVI